MLLSFWLFLPNGKNRNLYFFTHRRLKNGGNLCKLLKFLRKWTKNREKYEYKSQNIDHVQLKIWTKISSRQIDIFITQLKIMQGMTCDGMYLNISSILLVVIFRRLKCLLTRFLRRSSICWREVCKWGFAGRFWRSLRHCFINQKLKCSTLTSWPSNLVCQIGGLWYPWRGSAVV